MQEVGETSQEMLKDDMKRVESIISKRPSGHYWVLIHHKPTGKRLSTGEHLIMKTIKAYDRKPQNLLGTIVIEVKDGEILDYSVHLHDAPIAWDKIVPKAGFESNPVVLKTNAASDYIYNE